MSRRIPAWVNRVWDLAERRPWVTLMMAGVAAGTATVPWSVLPLSLFSVGWFCFWGGIFIQQARVAEARDERDAANREVGRLRARVAELDDREFVEAQTKALTYIPDRGAGTKPLTFVPDDEDAAGGERT